MSTPPSEQHDANLPSITTAGTDRTPSSLARRTTSMAFMSCTTTSQDGHASRLTASTASWQIAQSALKISTLRFVATCDTPYRLSKSRTEQLMRKALRPGAYSKVKCEVRPFLTRVGRGLG